MQFERRVQLAPTIYIYIYKENHLRVIFYTKRKKEWGKELMKMIYGSLSSRTRPFNLALNTTLAYRYKYSGGMIFFFFQVIIN